MNAIDRALVATLDKVARVPNLLVACDYDGTLAPIVNDPADAIPLPDAIAVLRDLASLPNTTVAVVSSRALRDLATLSRLPNEVLLVGSHGIEFDTAFVQRMEKALVELRAELKAELERLTLGLPGVLLEVKPAGVAVHIRMADPAIAEQVELAVLGGPGAWPGISVTNGKKVLDLSVLPPQKGVAVETLRSRFNANAVLFLGDDRSDEEVFHRLRGPDVGIKVGEGNTQAPHRITDPVQTAAVLKQVKETRRQWITGEPYVRIERHSMLANGQTVALLTPDARVTWFCHPRPDSPPIFAHLLGGPTAGHFTVTPASGGRRKGQRYLESTMTVETRWTDLTVTDWLDLGTGQAEGATEGRTSLVRRITGTATARIEFAPRPDFGRIQVRLEVTEDGVLVTGGSQPTALWSSPGVVWAVTNDVAHALVDLGKIGPVTLDLRCASDDLTTPESTVDERQLAAEVPWRTWAGSLQRTRTEAELVLRSALTLRGLCYQPTGAILAAATTSLPELLGGVRNWDYRYCWLRDATMSARVLVDLGSLAESEALLDWIDRCVARTGGHPERLNPLYTIEGTELPAEATIEAMPGYRGARPVRVGNLASGQLQLDVFGPVADLIAAVVERRGSVRDHEWQLMHSMVSAVERRWSEVDHGIWEARLDPRHHVHSKVMCWWTIVRALDVARVCGRGESDTELWAKLRDEIRADVLLQGWSDEKQAFTEAYGGTDLDAAALWVGLAGMVPDDDPRFLSTVLAVERELRSGPTVFRYKWDDGQPGIEGGFHLCTTWLIEAYLRTGQRVEAEALFEQFLESVGPTGLIPEMYDQNYDDDRGLGNHPQAYSHLGLIRLSLLFDRYRVPAVESAPAEDPTRDIPVQAVRVAGRSEPRS